jgi:branched-chain amino acid transport system ATP-binding protein
MKRSLPLILERNEMLRIEDLNAYYGPIHVLKNLNIKVEKKSIVCLIGANGAGKTTLLKAISGMVHRTGLIEWDNQDISACTPAQIAKRGVLHVPEGRHVFPGLTVLENLEVGSVNWRGFFGKKNDKKELDYVFNMFPRLAERKKQLSWSLSGGEQQMLAIGRALMGHPNILLLDEPSMGLAPLIIEELFKKIKEINNNGTPILMVEQNARKALEISDYAYVISQGEIALSGPAKELISDQRIVNSYFGAPQRRES